MLLALGSALAVALALAAPVMTAVGARRRGRGLAASLVAGLFFPVTWIVWYVRDEHPYRRPRTRRFRSAERTDLVS